MNPVIQEDPTGCGIASAAALAGVSYQTMKRKAARLGITPENGALWSSTEPMQRLLPTLGFQISRTPQTFAGWESLPSTSLLAIKWHMDIDGPVWHWVVFKREEDDTCVLDPKRALKSNIRRDFGRMKPKWFLKVTKIKNGPNKAMQPTPVAVTPRANARGAPSTSVADL